jgi:hypothetical protein
MYGMYKLAAYAHQALDWAAMRYKLNQLEVELESLKNLRPATIGHPEWARADGYFNQSRSPFPRMRATIAAAKEACARKDHAMFVATLKKAIPGEEIMSELGMM